MQPTSKFEYPKWMNGGENWPPKKGQQDRQLLNTRQGGNMLHIWDKYICCNISGFLGEATKICITSVRIKKHKISICIAVLPSAISAVFSSFSCSTLIWAIGNRKDSTHSYFFSFVTLIPPIQIIFVEPISVANVHAQLRNQQYG